MRCGTMVAWWVVLAIAGAQGAAPPAPPVLPKPAAGAVTVVKPGAAMPKETLVGMYRTALGEKYPNVDLEKLYAAHQLVEQYFATTAHAERQQLVQQIEALGVDANAVGRIVHIRMNWPALEGGAYYVNETIGPHDVHYFLGVPAGYDRTKAYPLLVKLPTAAAFLTTPPPTADQVAEIYKGWIKEELTAHPDALVLMPLLDFGELYGPSYEGMNNVMQALFHAAGRVNVDPARVYMAGHSMAAHAVWNLALHYATYFAAVNPMAGSANQEYQRVRMSNLRNTLPVVWHDADDTILKADASRQLVRLLRNRKIDVDYEETKGLGHGPKPDLVEKLYQKMRARVRALYPKQVTIESDRPDSLFNRLDWVHMYQPANPGKERRVWFTRGIGRMIVNEIPFSTDATLGANRIDAQTDNVESMRFYVNDQMIDFAKPVTVVVNKKVRFEGLVKPSIDEMLKDQVFLGRGWRYFTGVVDVDLGERATSGPATTRSTGEPATRRGTIEIIGPGGQPKIYEPKK